MKRTTYNILVLLATVLLLGSCNTYLEQNQYDSFDNTNYWTNEANVRAYAQGCYLSITTAASEYNYFVGYDADYTVFGGYFTGDGYNDDIAYNSPKQLSKNVDEASGKWNFENIRRVNIFIEKVPTTTMNDEAKRHWMGVARFFRAMSYSIMVKRYGDVPWYNRAPISNETDYIYKARDPRILVVDSIMEDFKYAVANMRIDDGAQQVNKYVAAAYMSRWMLFHATWLKYHGATVSIPIVPVDNAKLKNYFEEAKNAALVVINSGKYDIGNTYNELFSSEDLTGNKEVIFFRQYLTGVYTNALMSYNNIEEQVGGLTKNCLDSYLCNDGLPVGQSTKYQGNADRRIQGEFIDRDPRLYQCFVDSVRLSGVHLGFSPVGYACKKFLNEEWRATGSSFAKNNLSPADAPLIRYAEVLLNYAEATYELSTAGGPLMTQADIDLSINKIRSRALKKNATSTAVVMPNLQLSGGQPAVMVGGVLTAINDPKRDSDVDPLLWEIRRERRVELLMEGFRNTDLNRWRKFSYIPTGSSSAPTDVNMGAWLVKADWPQINFSAATPKVKLYYPTADQSAGYIWPTYAEINQRSFSPNAIEYERNYLNAIPVAQINLYKSMGYELKQNPGW